MVGAARVEVMAAERVEGKRGGEEEGGEER